MRVVCRCTFPSTTYPTFDDITCHNILECIYVCAGDKEFFSCKVSEIGSEQACKYRDPCFLLVVYIGELPYFIFCSIPQAQASQLSEQDIR